MQRILAGEGIIKRANMVKLCFFNLSAYSILRQLDRGSIGGTEVQLVNLSKYFSKAGNFETSFITSCYGQPEERVQDRTRITEIINLSGKFIDYVKAPFLIWKSLKKANADVYIASSAGVEIGIVAVFCKWHKKKFIYRTASSIDCDKTFLRERPLVGRVFQYGLRNADAVIAQNRDNKRLLKENNQIGARLIRNSFFIRGDISKKNKGYILWVGRMEPSKQPELFLEIAKAFPKQKFIMIAPKRNHRFDYFREVSLEAKKISNLLFIEYVPFDKIQKYFDEAKLFVCTSQFEGFPNVHLQACMGATPIVSLNINPDNYINSNDIGYCARGDMRKMKDGIGKIISDDKDWNEKSKNAIRYVQENHDIKKIGLQWEALIYNILEQ